MGTTPTKYEACVNGDGRPIHSPSEVLCKECFEALSKAVRDCLKTIPVTRRKGIAGLVTDGN